jgi:hypothetical protein
VHSEVSFPVRRSAVTQLGVDEVFAELLPEDKGRALAELQGRGLRVATSTNGGDDTCGIAPARAAHPGLRLRRKTARDGPPHPWRGDRPCAGRNPIKEVALSGRDCWNQPASEVQNLYWLFRT